ncbi:MAG: endonuclease/exonuclease/phosphatase family protein [Paracoccaceae bacterium]
MKAVSLSLALVAAILLALGYLGHMSPMLDAIAIGRWVALYALLICLLVYTLLARRRVLAILLLIALATTALSHRLAPIGEDGPVRIYTKNLLYLNTHMAPIIADIEATTPDVVVLQEVSHRNRFVLEDLSVRFPFQAKCPWQEWNGMAILSRWPIGAADTRCSTDRALMAAKIERPDGTFWMVGAHLQHPWPDIQWPLLEASLPVLDGLDTGVIVAGDFNTLFWTAAAQKVGAMTGTHPIRTKRPTFFLRGVGLHLDQVWAAGGRAQVRPRFGSDHRGIVADVWP